ncbi:hypothetical protein [Flexivirga sp. B27]
MRTPSMLQVSAVAGIAAATIAVSAGPAAAVTKLSQSKAASQFKAAGVTSSSTGGCTTRSNKHCTSYEQINQTTVSGVITLKKASGCAIRITGGTEVGHASGTYSHYNGYKVDIAKSSCLNSYVKNHFTYVGKRGDGFPQWKAASGNLYCDEGNHWDVTYYKVGD